MALPRCSPIALAITIAISVVVDGAELPPEATLLDPDIVWDMWDPGSATLSPDGKSIAYISKGAVWICSVTTGPPVKLADLPNTSTTYMSMPKFDYARTNFKRIRKSLGNAVYNRSVMMTVDSVHSLAWTPSQDGIVYGLRTHAQSNAKTAVHKVMHASTDGAVTTIAVIEREVGAQPHSFTKFHVTADKNFIIAWGGSVPMIWDVLGKRPRATCFDYLVPSSSSNRFLGIEIDTRQLVVANAEFEIINRLDATFSMRRTCDVIWSNDERFAICRSRFEHPSDRWEGFRIDFSTGEKRQLKGKQFTDRFSFTGRGGEAIRMGIKGVRYDHLDKMTGAYLAIVPDGVGQHQIISQFTKIPERSLLPDLLERPYYPLPMSSSDYTLFAMALPKSPDDQVGFVYHLLDRSGRQWQESRLARWRFSVP